MLAEDRLEKIVALVNAEGSMSAAELMERLEASESTIRRDLTRLAEAGRIVKVHGGATSVRHTVVPDDQSVSEKHDIHIAEKTAIARYAAGLIGPDDFVFVDAGSTTGLLVEHISETRATYVTNSIANARALRERSCRVLVIGGELKEVTGALVGAQAVEAIGRFRFTIGFFGVNGAVPALGLMTPEVEEALVKRTALSHTLRPYVLCDSTKFSQVSPVEFGAFEDATIVTEAVPKELAALGNIVTAC